LEFRSFPINQKDVHRRLLEVYFEYNEQQFRAKNREENDLKRHIVLSGFELRHKTEHTLLHFEKYEPKSSNSKKEPEKYRAVDVQGGNEDFNNHI